MSIAKKLDAKITSLLNNSPPIAEGETDKNVSSQKNLTHPPKMATSHSISMEEEIIPLRDYKRSPSEAENCK